MHAIPTAEAHQVAAAAVEFNKSEHCRTISGVARSLGMPTVNVSADATRPGSVWIVASWELCWYRYEVVIADNPASVRLDGQGYELNELTPDQQLANASCDESGRIALA